MKKFISRLSKLPWFPICFTTIVIIFFSIRLIITYDSAHYLNYVTIFEGKSPASSWDIVRGPIFPAIIFIFNTMFGKTSAGILVGTFIFYLIFAIICYKICEEICKNLRHRKSIQNSIFAISILNHLILGYFHVLLTEFIAITVAMLNIFIAYKWIFCDLGKKKKSILYILYFIFSAIFCYHLKQSYIVIVFAPLITSAIISIMKDRSLKNIFYRIGVLIATVILLFLSIVTWNKILIQIGADMDTGRDSSSLLSRQILEAYQISYNTDQATSISTFDAINILLQNFLQNPLRIVSIYISNYCGLTSNCLITTTDSVHYTPTLIFAGINTFENTAIAYRPYGNLPNIFIMPDYLYNNSIVYGESSSLGIVAASMNIFKNFTNILFKLSTALCFIALIVLIALRFKQKDHKYSKLFIINAILLATSFLHLASSAGLGLIIDRYAIEIFVPSMLGIFGTCLYIYLVTKNRPVRKKTISHKLKRRQRLKGVSIL